MNAVVPFGTRLAAVQNERGGLCVGIDPHRGLLADWSLPDSGEGVREFGLRVVEAAAGVAGVVKPQVAFFERHGAAGYAALEVVIAAARAAGLLVLADVKRGDVGSTVDAYGEAWLEPGAALESDAMTAVAYQGVGSLTGVLDRAARNGKGVIVVAAASNPEAAQTQGARRSDGRTVAAAIVDELRPYAGTAGVVLGATIALADYGLAAADLDDLIILAPGFGAQGARIADLPRLFGPAAPRVLVSVSRSVLAAGPGGVRAAITAARDEVAACRILTPPDVDRIAASRAAVAARRARARVKGQIAGGERRALDVVEAAWRSADPTIPEATLRVRELLTSMHALGPVRADRAMERLEIARSKRVGGLGSRQRERLRAYLEEREGEGGADSGRPTPSRLVVLAGPTAVGKGTVSRHIRETYPDVLLSVSATTRPARPGEIDGEHYYFISDHQFDQMVAAGEFLEHATVHNAYRYGTPRPPIEKALAQGRSVLLEIDLQGARAVRAAMPDALLVFLLPPTWDELVRRLLVRGTESPAEQARRLDTARRELEAQDEFDVKVVNDEVGQAAREVVELLAVPKI